MLLPFGETFSFYIFKDNTSSLTRFLRIYTQSLRQIGEKLNTLGIITIEEFVAVPLGQFSYLSEQRILGRRMMMERPTLKFWPAFQF